jgi:methionine synthase / methylenetetrahydrofolate reductase(NADPH)
MAPKRGTNVRDLVEAAEMLLEAGADAINVADNPTGKMKMSPWALAHILQLELHIDTILHFPTRGRNLQRFVVVPPPSRAPQFHHHSRQTA